MNRIESFWDKMSGKYDRHAAAKYADAYEKTLNISKEYLNKSDVALDFASGTGITTIPLAGCVKEIDALDISPKMLEIAEKKARDNNVQNIRFLVGSLFDSPLQQNHYDVVMAFNVLYFFEDIPQVLSRIHALLKPGGVFLSATDCLGKRSKPVSLISHLLYKVGLLPYFSQIDEQDLRKMIEDSGFKMIYEENLYDDPVNYFAAARK